MKGSANRAKARRRLARAHRRIRHTRGDWLHKQTTDLVRGNDVIAIEDLNVKGMTRSARGTRVKPGKNVRAKAGLNRVILATGFAEYRRQLDYKCQRAGRTLVVLDRWYPSSKTCSACAHLHQGLTLGMRRWTCPACRIRHDRDVNAAKNILTAGRAASTGVPGGDACGADVRHSGPSGLSANGDEAGNPHREVSPQGTQSQG